MKRIAFLLLFGLVSLSSGKKPQPYPFKYPANFGGRYVIPADNPTTTEGVYLGRFLFYEKKLSINNNLSCASCHDQKLAFTEQRFIRHCFKRHSEPRPFQRIRSGRRWHSFKGHSFPLTRITTDIWLVSTSPLAMSWLEWSFS